MFEIASASLKIWNLQRKKRARDAKYLKQIADATTSGKSKEEIQEIWDERLQFANDLDGAVALIETWILTQRAETL